MDQLGNWPTFKQDDNGNGSWDLDQNRDHNAVNELTEFTTTSWVDPAYDDAGNMTTMPQPKNPISSYTATYDAWNRLVKLQAGMTVVATYEYDGQNHRIICDETGGGIKRHFYYNERWQVVEERIEVMGNEVTLPLARYVWHPYYIDALAVRYYDADTDGDYAENNDGRQWYLQDANFNVTSVVNDSGTVLERYSYTPYGEVTFLEDDFDKRMVQESAIGNNYLYTGRERDSVTGMQLNRQRWYHAPLGRWTSRDPIGYAGGWNFYEYVRGNPSVYVDPDGLKIQKCRCRWTRFNMIDGVQGDEGIIFTTEKSCFDVCCPGAWAVQGFRRTCTGTSIALTKDETTVAALCQGDPDCEAWLAEIMNTVENTPFPGWYGQCFTFLDRFNDRYKGGPPPGGCTIEYLEVRPYAHLLQTIWMPWPFTGPTVRPTGFRTGYTEHGIVRVCCPQSDGTTKCMYFDIGTGTKTGEFGGDDHWFPPDDPDFLYDIDPNSEIPYKPKAQ